MKKSISAIIVVIIGLLFSLDLYADVFPDNMRVSEDGRRLVLKAQKSDGLYNFDTIRTIFIDFEESNWQSILTENYPSRTDLAATMTVDGVVYDGVGVRYRGQTSYLRVNSDKKSFNVSVDFTHEDLDLMGYKTLNLNNCYDDPSFIKEALFSELIGRYIPTAKVNFVNLVINGENWGLYSNVQQLNNDFFAEWFTESDGVRWRAEIPDTVERKPPMDIPEPPPAGGNSFGAGKSSLNYLGDDYLVYTSNYTLKTEEEENPWYWLVEACKQMDQLHPQYLYDSLKYYLDVDRSLWHCANEIIFTDEDGYINKGGMDYYVYYEPESGRIHPIEYDGNSTFMNIKTNLGLFYRETDIRFPLMNKLQKSLELKLRYMAHLKTIYDEIFIDENVVDIIDDMRSLIEESVINDSKKLYSESAFNTAINQLKNFISDRKTNIETYGFMNAEYPKITNVNYRTNAGLNVAPIANERVTVTANISSVVYPDFVYLYYSPNLSGPFERILMHYVVNEGSYFATLKGFPTGTFVRFYIEARTSGQYPLTIFEPRGAEHDTYFYQVQAEILEEHAIVINELMASNSETVADPQGDYDDWIELFNTGSNDIELSGMYLSDKIDNPLKWQFPEGTILPAGEYLLVWADEDGGDEGLHTNFKLSASGEVLMLIDNDTNGNGIIDSLSFGQQITDVSWGRYPNGTGDFALLEPTPLDYNENLVSVEYNNGIALFKIYPNPFTDRFTIDLNIEKSAQVKLELVNQFGDSIGLIADDYFPVGSKSIKYNSNADISSGVYYLVISINGNISVEKMIKL